MRRLIERRSSGIVKRKEALDDQERPGGHASPSGPGNARVGGEVVEAGARWSRRAPARRCARRAAAPQSSPGHRSSAGLALREAGGRDRGSNRRDGSASPRSTRASSLARVVLPDPEQPAMPSTTGGNGSRGASEAGKLARRSEPDSLGSHRSLTVLASSSRGDLRRQPLEQTRQAGSRPGGPSRSLLRG